MTTRTDEMTKRMKVANIDAPEFILFVVKERLTDGSHVFNVIFGEMKFYAEDQEHAEQLAECIADEINEHTVNTAGVVFEY